MVDTKSILFICPFWGQDGHVGTIRAERHVNWLVEEGYKITIVKAGLSDRIEHPSFGELITVRDPFEMFEDDKVQQEGIKSSRKPNKLRRFLGYLFFVPDPTIAWARRVMKSATVLDCAASHKWFMASSPSESAFIPASYLANKFSGRFWMDLRDGWLDEPMKPLLRTSRLQRFRERLIEQRMIDNAKVITVTSHNWKKLLVKRYPNYDKIIHVIPNAFESRTPLINVKDVNKSSEFRLIYAGRIYSSRPERNLELLLTSINQHIELHNVRLFIEFIGTLSSEEENEITRWSEKLTNITFIRSTQLIRAELITKMSQTDGLLLLSESYGSIPAKFFDYVMAGRPILAVTSKESAFDEASKDMGWVKKIYTEQPELAIDNVSRFFAELGDQIENIKLPMEFSPEIVKHRLTSILRQNG
jgi:hypothetical protein